MKKIILAALFTPLLALAQSYPSPTYQNLTVLGTFTASGKVGLASLASQAANTVVANVTGSSASPTAFAMPSCSTAASALTYTTSTGFTCNTAVNAAQLGGATFAAPGPIGSGTASTGAFTALSASSTVSGSGFSTYLASPPAIGGTTAGAGSFTTLTASSTLTANGAVAGSGFSSYLGSPPAIGTTSPAAGSFTTLSSSGAFNPSGGITGVTSGSSAGAGQVGQVISSTVVFGSAVSLTTGVAATITSISLTAGDWDVWGTVCTATGSTTTVQSVAGGINTVAATLPGPPANGMLFNITAPLTTGQGTCFPVGMGQENVSSTTTVYLVGYSAFGTSTQGAYGYIAARRRR